MTRASMHNARYRLRISVLLAMAGLALAACKKEKSVTPVVPPMPPLRHLTTHPLFGGMPTDNGILDPQFAVLNGQGWMPYQISDMPRLSRGFLPGQTPLGQPALWVPTQGNTIDLLLLGMAKPAQGPLDVSVWFGRKLVDDDTDLVRVLASLLGMFGDAYASVDLVLDARQQRGG